MTLLPWREHPAARLELIDAINWYEEQQKGLGERLNNALMSNLALVRERPDSAPPVRELQRDLMIRRRNVALFPYGIIHFVRDDELVVAAYAHNKRRPGYWRKRLQDF